MKFFADTVTTFKGPLREQRAAELVDALPPGAAEHLGDGVVKMRRNVVATGWCLEAEAPRPRRPITPFAALIIFACSFLGAAACVVAGEGAAPISGGFWAPPPLVAQSVPPPENWPVIGTVLIAFIVVVLIVGGVFASIIGGFTLIEKIRGTTKVKAETQQSNEGPGRIEFDLHIEHLSSGMSKLQTGQDEIMKKLEQWSGEQYRARGRMHRDVNTLKNAMHFWAGKMAGSGDPDAKRLVAILDTKDDDGGDT